MDDPKLWILCGNVMEQLKLVADESVHCVVTSPPFYGLRDYGTEPIIWTDEKHVLCSEDKHEWGEDQPSFHAGQVEQTKWKNISGPGVAGNVSRGNYCQKCGAWRGHLGLEPTPDCSRLFMELRDDLTEEEVEYVLSELRNYGAI